MSELREECYKCLNNQSCPNCADYGSIICMTKRKFKMPKNEEDSIYAIKFATMQQQINEKEKRIQELEEQLIFIKARQIKTTNNVSDKAKAMIYDSFDKIFYDDIEKKEKLQAILDTEEYINKFDVGKYKDAINLVLFLAKELLEGEK